jgi:thiamine kinase-like enzyme
VLLRILWNRKRFERDKILNCKIRKIYYFSDISNSESLEGVFVFENLTYDCYRLGPRDKLDEKHIMLLTEKIAKLHATSFAVKIQDRKSFDELVDKLKFIPFHRDDGKSMFHPLYDIALERVHRNISKFGHAKEFQKALEEIYEKFISVPASILQKFADSNDVFNVIIHGDYNRNNVMFKYESIEGSEVPIDLKMFDFQWVKYASPALDLSFYLYMNLDPDIMDSCWEKVLKFYHEILINSLVEILQCTKDDERLQPLNYSDFLKHFANHAFYGCFISAHFLPIMLCDESILPSITGQLMSDLYSNETREICLPAGGEKALKRVFHNLEHAFKKGYLKPLLND